MARWRTKMMSSSRRQCTSCGTYRLTEGSVPGARDPTRVWAPASLVIAPPTAHRRRVVARPAAASCPGLTAAADFVQAVEAFRIFLL